MPAHPVQRSVMIAVGIALLIILPRYPWGAFMFLLLAASAFGGSFAARMCILSKQTAFALAVVLTVFFTIAALFISSVVVGQEPLTEDYVLWMILMSIPLAFYAAAVTCIAFPLAGSLIRWVFHRHFPHGY